MCNTDKRKTFKGATGSTYMFNVNPSSNQLLSLPLHLTHPLNKALFVIPQAHLPKLRVLSPKSKTTVSPVSRSYPFPRVPFELLSSPILSFASVFHLLAPIFHPPACLHLHAFSQPRSVPQFLHVLSSTVFYHIFICPCIPQPGCLCYVIFL